MTKPRRKHRAMFQDEKGRWWLDYYTPDGKRRRKLCGSHEAAKAKLSEVETDKRRGTYTDENAAPRFGEYAGKYLEQVSTHKNSCDREGRLMKNLIAYFGNTRISKIKRSKVREYRNERCKSVKPATVNREIALLRHMFNVAKDDDLVGTNPARGGPGLTAFKEKPRLRFLLMPEVNTLLGVIDARITRNRGSGKKKWQYLRTAVVVALHTGMRKTENLSLRWDQIDWEKRNILLEDTKNDGPRRVGTWSRSRTSRLASGWHWAMRGSRISVSMICATRSRVTT